LKKETEQLINEVGKELHALRLDVEQKGNVKLLRTYQELRSMLE